jgi:hypothetical protein
MSTPETRSESVRGSRRRLGAEMPVSRFIVLLLAGFGLVAFIGAILILGLRGLFEGMQPGFTPVDGPVFVGVAGALATIFGAVVGIEIPGSGLFAGIRGKPVKLPIKISTFAEVAALVYAVGLFLAFGFWLIDADKANVASALTSLVASLGGVVVGALYVAAEVNKP